MHRNKKKRNIVIIFLIIILLCMVVGYATYSTNLKLKGTSEITSSWDIKITNVTQGTPSGQAENAIAPDWDELSASFEANLYSKGDAMEYDVTIENKGSLDAKLQNVLTNIEKENNEAVNITFSGYTKGEILKAGSIKIIHVRIEYNPNYEGEETSSEVEINFDYVQNNNEISPPENTHLVKYDCTTNGGNDCSNNNEYLLKGEDVDLTKKGTKEDYDFIGWNTDKYSQEALTELKVGEEDITLYAIYKAKDTTPPIIDSVNTSTTTNSITVIVSAHDDESGIVKYEFSINDGNYIDNGNNNVYTFKDLMQGTNYNIKVRVTNGIDLTAQDVAIKAIDLTESATESDGLYEDNTVNNRYIYKGKSPNNYIQFNNELWRIISVESDRTIKILRNGSMQAREYDNANNRSSTYCNSKSNGCNTWGSSTTTYNANNEKVTSISDTYSSSSTYALPSQVASLNTYLNGEYYNSLTSTAQSQIDNHYFNIGNVSVSSSNTLEKDMLEEGKYKWLGKIGLLNITDYVKASNNSNCTKASDYGSNSACYKDTPNHNWMINNMSNTPRFINGKSGSRSNVWGINNTGYNIGSSGLSKTTYGVSPALYLKSSVKIVGGKGTSTNPYILGSGVSTSELEKPTFSESATKPKIVTITYPSGCGSTLTCSYQKDNESVVNVTSNTVNIEFTKSGTLVANVSDGKNTASSSYTVTIFQNGGDAILGQVPIVTTGDGLYKDAYEDGRYFYKGKNPNNYITFNDESWRIISIEPDKTIKIMRNESVGKRSWNLLGEYNDWTFPASLNVYLNGIYLTKKLNSTAQSQILAKDFSIGTVGINEKNLSGTISSENSIKWNGKVALPTVSEYIRSNSNQSGCGSVYKLTSATTCNKTTWMYIEDDWWLLTSDATYGDDSFYVLSNGQLNTDNEIVFYAIRPAVYISSTVKIAGGTGTSNDPFTLG